METASSNTTVKDALHDWVEEETRALDVVASWETLCDVYRTLEFNDPLSDAMRMEEYKWIIAEMNKHLSRARKKLMPCSTPEAMMTALMSMFNTETNVANRMSLTYHKLRQMWVNRMLSQLNAFMEKEEESGRADYWNE